MSSIASPLIIVHNDNVFTRCRHFIPFILIILVIAFVVGRHYGSPERELKEFPVIDRSHNDYTFFWKKYLDKNVGFSIMIPDGVIARKLSQQGQVEFIRKIDKDLEIAPQRLDIQPVGPLGADPAQCRQYFCVQTDLLQRVQFNNAYGVRPFDAKYEYYLTDAKRSGRVVRIFADDTVDADFMAMIATFRFER